MTLPSKLRIEGHGGAIATCKRRQAGYIGSRHANKTWCNAQASNASLIGTGEDVKVIFLRAMRSEFELGMNEAECCTL